MSVLINKCLLLFLCLSSVVGSGIDASVVAAFLAAVTMTCFASYFDGKLRRFFAALQCAGALFFPPLLGFLPLGAYDCFSDSSAALRVLWILPFLGGIQKETPGEIFSSLLLCLLAALLALRTDQYETLLNEYHQVRDDTTELSLSLQEKNKELIRNQNYEIELATLSERNRIAREIHDNVGHLLTRSLLQVGALLVVYGKDPDLKEALSSVKDTLTDAMNSVRQSVHDLHEDAVDLKRQLVLLTEGFTFCPVELVFDCGPLPKETTYTVIAIVKEALSNIARHSNATKGTVSVLEHPSLYQLIIQDNGTLTPVKTGGGIGLSGMEERVRALGGNFRVTHSNGFRIFISIPKQQTFKEVTP